MFYGVRLLIAGILLVVTPLAFSEGSAGESDEHLSLRTRIEAARKVADEAFAEYDKFKKTAHPYVPSPFPRFERKPMFPPLRLKNEKEDPAAVWRQVVKEDEKNLEAKWKKASDEIFRLRISLTLLEEREKKAAGNPAAEEDDGRIFKLTPDGKIETQPVPNVSDILRRRRLARSPYFTLPRAEPETIRGKVYLLLTADTKDENIGAAAAVDLENVETFFTRVFQDAKNPYLYLKGEISTGGRDQALSISLVRNHYHDLKNKLRPEDTVVFYFSGHGQYDERIKHQMYFPWDKEIFPTSVIRKWMTETGAGQVVLIGDMCSSLAEKVEGAAIRPLAETQGNRWPVVEALFFNHVGVTELYAASRSENAIATAAGSIFTNDLIPLLASSQPERYLGKDPIEWHGFANAVQRATVNSFTTWRQRTTPELREKYLSLTPYARQESIPSADRPLALRPSLDFDAPAIFGPVEIQEISVRGERYLKVSSSVRIQRQRFQPLKVFAHFSWGDKSYVKETDAEGNPLPTRVVELSQSLTPTGDDDNFDPLTFYLPYEKLGRFRVGSKGRIRAHLLLRQRNEAGWLLDLEQTPYIEVKF